MANGASIDFEAEFDGGIHKVALSQPNGTNSMYWSIAIDNYFCGCLYVIEVQYWYYDNKFNAEDIQAMVDRITEATGEGFKRANFKYF